MGQSWRRFCLSRERGKRAGRKALTHHSQRKALAPRRPEWKDKHPFKAVLAGGLAALKKLTERDLLALLGATHVGMTTDEYARTTRAWFATAKHPRFKRLFKECVYQPQLELLAYLRANGFKTYIVTGGGVDFVRAFAEEVYGVPPEQVIGSSAKMRFEMRNGQPAGLSRRQRVGQRAGRRRISGARRWGHPVHRAQDGRV